jgi:hypothetical protein
MNIKELTGILAHYIMRLQPYDIDIIIKPGHVHSNADALSRMPHRHNRTAHFIERLPKQGPFLLNF